METPLHFRVIPGALRVIVPRLMRNRSCALWFIFSDLHFGRVDERLIKPLIAAVNEINPDLWRFRVT